MSDHILTSDPVVRVQEGTWCRFVDVDGLGLRRPLSFPHRVSWLRRAEAEACLIGGGGKIVEAGNTYVDAYGFLSCLDAAVHEAREMAREHGVGSGPFSVEARLTVRDVPVIPLGREPWDSDITPPRYRLVPTNWIAHGDLAIVERWQAASNEERAANLDHVRTLGPIPVLDAVPAWGSRDDPEDGVQAIERVLAAALAGFPDAFASEARARIVSEVFEVHA